MGELLRLDFVMINMPCQQHVNCQAQTVRVHNPPYVTATASQVTGICINFANKSDFEKRRCR